MEVMSGNQEAFHTAMNQGHSAAWDQNWPEAVSFYRKALDEFPNDPMALISIGLAFLEMKDFESALTQYQKASAISPNDPVPYEKMAYIYESMGRNRESIKVGMQAAELQLRARDVEKSIESWVHVIMLDPENLNARTRLAMIYDKMGRKQEAAGEYLSAASLMQAAGDTAKAIQAVRYCLQIAPDNIEVQNAMKLLKSNEHLPKPNRPKGSGWLKTARMENLQKLQAITGESDEDKMDPVAEARQRALEELADMLFDQTDENPNGTTGRRAVTSLTRGTGGLSLEQAERTRILLHLGHAIDLQSQGNEKRAAEELQRVLDIGLEKTAVYFDLGMLLTEDSPELALRYLQHALRRKEYALGSQLLIGKIHERQGNLRNAAIAYLSAFRFADIQTVPEELAGELSQLYEPIMEAQNHENNNETLASVCQSVRTQLMRLDWREYLRKAREQMPSTNDGMPPIPLMEMLLHSRSSKVVDALINVKELAKLDKTRSAMEEAFHALQFAPTYLPLHIQIGDLLIKEGHIQRAVDKFLLVAELYEVRGEIDQAIRVLKRVSTMVPMDISVRNNLIELLSSHERIDEAISEYYDMGEIYYRLAELDKARQSYLSALRLAQQSRTNRIWAVQILTKVADIDMQRLDWRQALRIFEQLRTLQPEEKVARMQLIDINFRLTQDDAALKEVDDYIKVIEENQSTKESLDFIQELIDERPEKIELRRRLAEALIRGKQVKKAIEQMDQLADKLLDNGDTWGAIEMLEAVIALNPKNIEDYRQVLKQIKYGK
jgi:tetratricopeptide (TPR) repeat protein